MVISILSRKSKWQLSLEFYDLVEFIAVGASCLDSIELLVDGTSLKLEYGHFFSLIANPLL